MTLTDLPADQTTSVCDNEALPSSTATEAMTINFMITVSLGDATRIPSVACNMCVTYLSSFDDEVMLAVFHLMLVFIISKEERVGQVLFLTRVELEAHAEQRLV